MGTLRGHKKGIWCVRFSPVDQCVATSSADSTIKIWALSDLTCVKTFEGHTSSVLKFSFMSRGMQLISRYGYTYKLYCYSNCRMTHRMLVSSSIKEQN